MLMKNSGVCYGDLSSSPPWTTQGLIRWVTRRGDGNVAEGGNLDGSGGVTTAVLDAAGDTNVAGEMRLNHFLDNFLGGVLGDLRDFENGSLHFRHNIAGSAAGVRRPGAAPSVGGPASPGPRNSPGPVRMRRSMLVVMSENCVDNFLLWRRLATG